MVEELKKITQLLEKIIIESGDFAVKEQKSITPDDIKYKEPNNIAPVTRVDLAIDSFLRQEILKKFPNHSIISEEEESITGSTNFIWVIDPIDGTRQYMQGSKNFAITIAILHRKEIIIGAIYHPSENKLYLAKKGEGVFLNNKKLEPKKTNSNICYVLKKKLSINMDKEIGNCKESHIGTAALEFVNIATGSAKMFIYENAPIWDMAAGTLIVRELGGQVLTFDKKQFNLDDTNLIAYTYGYNS